MKRCDILFFSKKDIIERKRNLSRNIRRWKEDIPSKNNQ